MAGGDGGRGSGHRALSQAPRETSPDRGQQDRHLGGHNPPRVVVHGHRSASLPEPYRRYLERALREALGIEGSPLRVEFRQDANPYANKRSGNRPAGHRPPVNKPRPAPPRKPVPDHAV
jgi:KH-domain-like of EngA bacterial GTPase enzymes, C-terminal